MKDFLKYAKEQYKLRLNEFKEIKETYNLPNWEEGVFWILLVVLVFLYFVNLFIVGMGLTAPLTMLYVLRVLGIFYVPLGVFLGIFMF